MLDHVGMHRLSCRCGRTGLFRLRAARLCRLFVLGQACEPLRTTPVTSERWQLVERIYHAALEQAADTRTAFLAEACGADQELLADVQSLLASHSESSSFLELPVLHQAAAALANRTLHGLIGHRIDKYRVRDLLGSGGMGAVYLAHDEELGRDVAIKLLIDERAESPRAAFGILNEARAAACLNHPNICTVHEVVQFEGRPYLVMEYVAGLTLDRLIAVRGLSLDEVLRYGSEIADAIAHAHASGVLHRDLKTANVMSSRPTREGHELRYRASAGCRHGSSADRR